MKLPAASAIGPMATNEGGNAAPTTAAPIANAA